jgi:hypothetical protein
MPISIELEKASGIAVISRSGAVRSDDAILWAQPLEPGTR